MTEAERVAWSKLSPDNLAAELALVDGDDDARAIALREFAEIMRDDAKSSAAQFERI